MKAKSILRGREEIALRRPVSSRLFAQGRPIASLGSVVEDHATAQIDVEGGASRQLACSWKPPADRDAIIRGFFYGTKGGAVFYRVDGSFYNYAAEQFYRARREVLASAPEEWGGCAAVRWAQECARGANFDLEIESLSAVTQCLDAIYANGGGPDKLGIKRERFLRPT